MSAVRSGSVPLEDFCLTNDVDIDEITDKLKSIGYQYDDKLNQFKKKRRVGEENDSTECNIQV